MALNPAVHLLTDKVSNITEIVCETKRWHSKSFTFHKIHTEMTLKFLFFISFIDTTILQNFMQKKIKISISKTKWISNFFILLNLFNIVTSRIVFHQNYPRSMTFLHLKYCELFKLHEQLLASISIILLTNSALWQN